jgi:hypothetical protein
VVEVLRLVHALRWDGICRILCWNLTILHEILHISL